MTSNQTSQADTLNHRLWLETVSEGSRKFVAAAVGRWNAQADKFNQWAELGWDERNAILTEEEMKNA